MESSQELVDQIASLVRTELEGEGSGHDWWHIQRVWKTALAIAKSETKNSTATSSANNDSIPNLLIVELGALLHDIADYKFHGGDESAGGKAAADILASFEVPNQIVDSVVHIVDNVSFKGGHDENKMQSLEGKIVQDADRLDSMGAIGIARVFAYGGAKGREIHNPDRPADPTQSKEEYMKNTSSGINHFYEKLLKLKDLMNTDTGRELAAARHTFMQEYLERFYQEWDGKA